MIDHIWTVLARGHQETFRYIFNWLAWAVQHPEERAEVALVFRGKRGAGKGTLGNTMCRIFGQHAVHISSNTYEREVHESDSDGRTHTRYFKERGLYDQARSIEPRLKQRSDNLLGRFLAEKGCVNCWVLRHRGWEFPPLLDCRAKWEARFAGWRWRDANLAE
jgi:hypothetical protein